MTASSDPATRERSRVALVTGEAFPDLWVDDHPLRDALRARSVAVDTVRWDDEAADWSAYDLVVISDDALTSRCREGRADDEPSGQRNACGDSLC